MSWKSIKGIEGAGNEEEYVNFVKRFLTDEVMDSVLDGKYEGADKKLIEEKISADLSQIGLVFDPENIPLNSQRFRSMKIRDYLDSKLRPVCESTDEKWDDLVKRLDLNEEQKELAKEIEEESQSPEEEKKAAVLRPFCLYAIDAEHLYEQKLEGLPEDPIVFAKLAFEHEMDCAYEDDEDPGFDDEYEDLMDEEEEEEEEELEELEQEIEAIEGDLEVAELGSKIEKSEREAKTIAEEEFDEDDDDEYLDEIEDVEMEFPFKDEEIKVFEPKKGFELLGANKDQIIATLKELTGLDVSSFKYYSLPGRHYIVCWVDTLGIFGVRLCEPYTSILEEDEDEEEDEEE
ncbi:hypothetical protein AYI68_g5916 [Smittium mucronatum]|uniref:Uncharacterized protein n=1 Tax=Smittium mucronatum TaxID=133383 RepID=A0A1R0GSY3_9FUNG|nr:hypothetical protein AYI68_g5916 [Smittium mucronatum]